MADDNQIKAAINFRALQNITDVCNKVPITSPLIFFQITGKGIMTNRQKSIPNDTTAFTTD